MSDGRTYSERQYARDVSRNTSGLSEADAGVALFARTDDEPVYGFWTNRGRPLKLPIK